AGHNDRVPAQLRRRRSPTLLRAGGLSRTDPRVLPRQLFPPERPPLGSRRAGCRGGRRMTAATLDCTIAKLSSHTGAEVRGLDLREPPDPVTRDRLNQAFVEHSVLVFRDQQLTPPQLLATVQLFGEVFLQQNTKFALPDCPQIHY